MRTRHAAIPYPPLSKAVMDVLSRYHCTVSGFMTYLLCNYTNYSEPYESRFAFLEQFLWIHGTDQSDDVDHWIENIETLDRSFQAIAGGIDPYIQHFQEGLSSDVVFNLSRILPDAIVIEALEPSVLEID
jgi:hypothetical protein